MEGEFGLGQRIMLTIGSAGLVVVAAYLVVGLFINPPGLDNGPGANALAAIAANPSEQRLGTLLDWVFGIAVMVAVIFVAAALGGRRGGTLTAVGACIAAVGNLFHGSVVAVQLIAADMAASADRAAMGTVVDRINADPYLHALLLPLMLAFNLGLPVFAAGLWRAGVVPVWLVFVLVAGTLVQPLLPDAVNQVLLGTLVALAVLWMAAALVRRAWRGAPRGDSQATAAA